MTQTSLSQTNPSQTSPGQTGASPAEILLQLTNGYQVSQAIYVAATLGIADLLGAGARASSALAASTHSDPPSLYRLLRALSSAGVLHEGPDQVFSLTEVGQGLRSDAEQSLAGWAAFIGRPYQGQLWSSLLHSVQTGENAFLQVHGMSPWAYRAAHPEEDVIFNRAMTSMTLLTQRAVLEAYDFGRFATVLDVGGGTGTLLAAILQQYPALQGVLVDQAHVTRQAGPVLAAVAGRCRVVPGSFFDPLPAGADVHVLKAILHDWNDEECALILRRCREAISAQGTLLVIERLIGAPNEAQGEKFSDLSMMIGPGGRERSREDYSALFQASGFRLSGVTPTRSSRWVIEGLPV